MVYVLVSGNWEVFKSLEDARASVISYTKQARRGLCGFPQVYVPACGTCGGNCWNCFYADACPRWEDTGTSPALIEVEVEVI